MATIDLNYFYRLMANLKQVDSFVCLFLLLSTNTGAGGSFRSSFEFPKRHHRTSARVCNFYHKLGSIRDG